MEPPDAQHRPFGRARPLHYAPQTCIGMNNASVGSDADMKLRWASTHHQNVSRSGHIGPLQTGLDETTFQHFYVPAAQRVIASRPLHAERKRRQPNAVHAFPCAPPLRPEAHANERPRPSGNLLPCHTHQAPG
jgi:hypothetical protein